MKKSSKQADHFLHPYLFILKEGKQIRENFLDYSLLLLQIGELAVFPSPHRPKNYRPFVNVHVHHSL